MVGCIERLHSCVRRPPLLILTYSLLTPFTLHSFFFVISCASSLEVRRMSRAIGRGTTTLVSLAPNAPETDAFPAVLVFLRSRTSYHRHRAPSHDPERDHLLLD